jgi:hypothetical protein
MITDEKQTLIRIVEHFARTGSASDDQVKVTCLPDNKTSYVEQIGGEGRSVMLDEFHVDGKVIWAGYSERSDTVYLSTVSNNYQ